MLRIFGNLDAPNQRISDWQGICFPSIFTFFWLQPRPFNPGKTVSFFSFTTALFGSGIVILVGIIHKWLT